MPALTTLLPALFLGTFELSAPDSLSARELNVVTVVNTSSTGITVRLSAFGFPVKGKDGETVSHPLVLSQEAQAGADGGIPSPVGPSVAVTLAPAEVAYLRLSLEPRIQGGVPVGAETAHLVAYEEGTDAGASISTKTLKLPVVVEPAPVKSAVTSWNFSTRCDLLFRCASEVLLPVDLDPASSAALDVPGGVLSRLYNERGDMALLTVKGGTPGQAITAASQEYFEAGDGTLRLRTRVDSIDMAGVYTGKVKLGESEVGVNMRVSHHWLFMLLASLAGALVLLAQRSLSIYRGVASFDQRAADFRARLEGIQQAFRQEVEKVPGAKDYDLLGAIQARLDELKRLIRGEARRTREPIDEDKSPAFLQLGQLEDVATDWSGLAQRLVTLNQRLEEFSVALKDDRRTRNATGQKEPTVVTQARALLEGKAVTLEQQKEVSTQVSAALVALETWKRLNERAEKLLADALEISKLPAGTQPQATAKTELEQTRESLQKAWLSLWTVDPRKPAELMERVETPLNQATHALMQLAYKLDPSRSGGYHPESGVLESLPGAHEPARTVVARQPTGVATPGGLGLWLRSLAALLGSVWMTDGLLILIALVLACFFQLDQTYLGRAWGEPKDYFAAFVTGYGSQGLVSIVDALLGRRLASTLHSVVGGR